MSLKAGVDVDITYEPAYMKPLVENVEEGKVSMAILDRAVRRVLEQKFRLGLFDQPYADSNQAEKVVHSQDHQELALRAAREGAVLLKNDGSLLPLSRSVKSIAVVGPDADAPQNQLGDYSPSKVLQHVTTILEGIKTAVPASVHVTYAKGCGVMGDDKGGFTEAVNNARSADVAVVVVGEQQERRESATSANDRPTDGEGFDVASLDLTG